MSLSRDPSDATSDRDRASHSQRDTWVHALQCRANELINSSVKDKLVHANYRLHVVNKWKNLYFPYNEAKYILGSNAVSQFDVYFDGVIRALVNFIEHMVELIQHDTLCTMEAFGVMKDEEIIDREFFKLRSRIMDLKKFQKFNTYFVLKFVQVRSFRCSCSQSLPYPYHFVHTEILPSDFVVSKCNQESCYVDVHHWKQH
jgi:hypothetical protein